jgi:hypothetical protein
VPVLYLRAALLLGLGSPVSSTLGVQIIVHIYARLCYLAFYILQQVF